MVSALFIIIMKFDYLCHLQGSSVPYTNAYFGQGAGLILFTGLTCTGTESSLFSCAYSNIFIGLTTCSHTHDAGVMCSSGWQTCQLVFQFRCLANTCMMLILT